LLNIDELRMGAGTVRGLGRDLAGALVVTMPDAWALVKDDLAGSVRDVCFVDSVDRGSLDAAIAQHGGSAVIAGIGGGMALDAAKYFSWRTETPLVTIPTVISTNAFATEAVGIREDAKVHYVGSVRSARCIIDFDLIAASPRPLSLGGICDVLSCHTGLWDWKHACDSGVSDHPWDAAAARKARLLVEQVAEYAGEIRDVSFAGIKLVVDLCASTVEICQPMGHFRAEEGSEHFLMYCLESFTRRHYFHGPVVALGIDLMSRLQDNENQWICSVIDACGLPRAPRASSVSHPELVRALRQLSGFVTTEQLWFSVANGLKLTDADADAIASQLEFAG
jgi:glycerol-1-phosphate dehydrogenase [NAD(P)+]